MNRPRRYVIWLHRYLGIPMSVVFVVWFVSGIVMMYSGGMPTVTADERLSRLPPIDLDAIERSPAEAAAGIGISGFSGDVTLHSLLGRPVYRFAGLTVFADTGEAFEGTTRESARRAAALFSGQDEERLAFAGTIAAPDQWTLTQRRNLPLDRFTVDDGAGTWLYVSQDSGEVTLMTTRRARLLAWLGTIPHWFYFAPLRVNQPLWYWTVVGASALGCLLAVLGLILGVIQFRRSKPFSLSKSIRYRGWMRWHYFTGAIFGVFALTWAFSGMLSMEPFAWTNATGLVLPRDVFAGTSVTLEDYPELDADRWREILDGAELKEIEYTQLQGEPYFLARYTESSQARDRERFHEPYPLFAAGDRNYTLVSARTMEPRRAPFPVESLLEHLQRAAPNVEIAEHELLQEYDAYYYSRGRQAPLPILRVKFNDPEQTWYYIDPAMSRIVTLTHRHARVERWLFNGLHSLDFSFWYDRRPLWDIGMIVLSIGGLTTSLIGAFLGMRRLWPRPKLRGNTRPTEKSGLA